MVGLRLFFLNLLFCSVALQLRLDGFCRCAVADSTVKNPYIEYIGQYPEIKKPEKKKHALRKIYDFLIQKDKQSGLVRPVGITGAANSDILIVDQGADALFLVSGKTMTVPKAVKRKEKYYTSLVAACALKPDEFLFTDSRLNKVIRLNTAKNTLSFFFDTLKLQQPTGIACSPATGDIWVVETGAHTVDIFSKDGTLIKKIGTRGTEKEQFNFPVAVWIDKNGDAYVVDAMNFRIQIFDKFGTFVNMFGEPGDASGFFARPKGVATDSYGNIYVTDALYHAVQVFNRKGELLYVFGRQGSENGQFWMPSGIYIDNDNKIYVADSYNSRVQIFQLVNGY
jgi:NHL repeat